MVGSRYCVHVMSVLKHIYCRDSVAMALHCSHGPHFLVSHLPLTSAILRRWFYKTDLLLRTRQTDTPTASAVAAKPKSPEVQVIGWDGEPLGSMSYRKAQQLARNKEFKLVLIDPKSKPGATYQMMTGIQKREAELRQKEAKRAQKLPSTKSLKVGATIAEHDLVGKISNIKEWLEKGHPVRVAINYTKSREGEEMVFNCIVAECKEVATVQQAQRTKTELTFVLVRKTSLDGHSTTTDSQSSTEKPLKNEELRKSRETAATSEVKENP